MLQLNKDMIIDNSKYYNGDIVCSTCGKVYNPAKDSKTLETLNVPPLLANIFCSRVCKEKYDEFLSDNRAIKSSDSIIEQVTKAKISITTILRKDYNSPTEFYAAIDLAHKHNENIDNLMKNDN